MTRRWLRRVLLDTGSYRSRSAGGTGLLVLGGGDARGALGVLLGPPDGVAQRTSRGLHVLEQRGDLAEGQLLLQHRRVEKVRVVGGLVVPVERAGLHLDVDENRAVTHVGESSGPVRDRLVGQVQAGSTLRPVDGRPDRRLDPEEPVEPAPLDRLNRVRCGVGLGDEGVAVDDLHRVGLLEPRVCLEEKRVEVAEFQHQLVDDLGQPRGIRRVALLVGEALGLLLLLPLSLVAGDARLDDGQGVDVLGRGRGFRVHVNPLPMYDVSSYV